MEYFEITSKVPEIVAIVAGGSVREWPGLCKQYGDCRRRKREGNCDYQIAERQDSKSGTARFEAHGIGRKEMKRKRYLDA